EGTAISFAGSATDPAGANDTLTYVWNFGDGSATVTGASASHVFADNGTYVITLTVSDEDGGTTSTTQTITVSNIAPTPTIDSISATRLEGTAISFAGSATDPAGANDTLTYVWNFGDGSATVTGASASHVFTDNGTYVITLTVSDEDGGTTSTTQTITVSNIAPTPTIDSISATRLEGTAISFAGSATDPAGANDSLTYVWNFGDGSATVTGASASHVFADNGTYVITLTVSDEDGGTTSTTQTITISNVAPTPTIDSISATRLEGTAISFAGSATDPAGANDALTYVWNFGDGSATVTGASASHVFTDNGTYVITLTVSDEDGGTTSTTQTITVSNVAPTPTIDSISATRLEGTSISFAGSATDPAGANDTLTYAWDFGDGSATVAGATASHVFADNGTFVITLTVSDEDGGTTSTTQTITVNNVAPTPTINSISATRLEGTAITFAGSASDPAGANDPLTYLWNFGDGSPGLFGANAEYTYADNGTYLVTLTVTDGDGGSASVTQTIIVSNVAPSASLSGPTTATTGSSITILSSTSDPAGALDPLTLLWTLTLNGSSYATQSGGSSYSFSPTLAGSYVISLLVSDGDGGSVTASHTVTVNSTSSNSAPTVAISGPASVVRGQELTWVFTATDPDAADQAGIFSWIINWGDGSSVQSFSGPYLVSVTHTFTAESSSAGYSVSAKAVDAANNSSAVVTKVVQVVKWQVQADPLHAGETMLVVGGSVDKDRIRVTRHGGSNGYYKLRIDTESDRGDCDDDEENEFTVRIYASFNGIIVYGQAGNDRIEIQTPITLWSILDGGAGNDRITGGGGNNIILGGDGNDELDGMSGRDLIIGGRGSDEIDGGTGDDLIIAGYTAYDRNRLALDMIMQEWTSNRSFTQRRSNIMGTSSTGLNGNWLFKPLGTGRTVFDDDTVDYLWGSEGKDWFLLNMNSAEGSRRDQIKDFRNGDEDDDIDLF
ncbi:MAG: PKD domain-containing protein, partial [Planctomycetaceae bacterium]|nr:PKD domain-containing protein [Planctomycetaceae bacterium]